MNSTELILFNRNTYIKVCKYLSDSLDSVELFIEKMHVHEEYGTLSRIKHLYIEIFNKKLLSNHISFEISQIPSSLYLRKPSELNTQNSFFHISLKLKTESIISLDKIYEGRLSRLLKFYKNLFSNIDNPSKSIGENIQSKYRKFLVELKGEIETFIKSHYSRQIIGQREKLSEQKLHNLPFPGFYHMTHVKNLENILANGLLSHTKAYQENLVQVDISNQSVNSRRSREDSIYHKPLHDYVPLYINPLNAMLYVKTRQNQINDIILFEVLPHIVAQTKEIIISDGNAASNATSFYGNLNDFDNLDWKILNAGYWCGFPDGKRIRCSEILIPEKIGLTYIQRIICNSEVMADKVCHLFPNKFGIFVDVDKKMFYL